MCITLLLMIIKRTICANPSLKSFLFLPTVSDFFCHYSSPFCCGYAGKMYCKNDHRIDLSSNPQLSAEHCNEYEDHRLQSNIIQNKITNNNNNYLLTLMLFQTFMTSEKHRMCVPEERNSSQLQFRNILFNLKVQIINSDHKIFFMTASSSISRYNGCASSLNQL